MRQVRTKEGSSLCDCVSQPNDGWPGGRALLIRAAHRLPSRSSWRLATSPSRSRRSSYPTTLSTRVERLVGGRHCAHSHAALPRKMWTASFDVAVSGAHVVAARVMAARAGPGPSVAACASVSPIVAKLAPSSVGKLLLDGRFWRRHRLPTAQRRGRPSSSLNLACSLVHAARARRRSAGSAARATKVHAHARWTCASSMDVRRDAGCVQAR